MHGTTTCCRNCRNRVSPPTCTSPAHRLVFLPGDLKKLLLSVRDGSRIVVLFGYCDTLPAQFLCSIIMGVFDRPVDQHLPEIGNVLVNFLQFQDFLLTLLQMKVVNFCSEQLGYSVIGPTVFFLTLIYGDNFEKCSL